MSTKPDIISRIERYSPDIFNKSAFERNQVGYIPRFLTQGSLPKRLTDQNEWQRTSNNFTHTIMSPSNIGVPGGAYSRLILIRIYTLATLTKSQEFSIGSNSAEFMNWMGLSQTGGKNGTLRIFKEHFIRCINCVVHTKNQNGTKTEYSIRTVIDNAQVNDLDGWNWTARIRLSDASFKESQNSAPTDLGALLCLSPGTLRMDIFVFLVSRLFKLNKPTQIPWKQLYFMFAPPGFTDRGFKQSFKKAFYEAKFFYPQANVEINKWGLRLHPSPNLIPSKY